MEAYTEVFSWGTDTTGQLGLGPSKHNKTHCLPRPLSFNLIIKQISCGEDHSGFIDSNGHIYTMGSNRDGKLGINSTEIGMSSQPCLVETLKNEQAISLSCGGEHSLVVCKGGKIYSWGQGIHGALGRTPLSSSWKPEKIEIEGVLGLLASCGGRHSALIGIFRQRKTLFTWGAGDAGQLGLGSRSMQALPVQIQFEEEVTEVSTGVFHTLILLENGDLYACGGNSFGQLGLGTKTSVVVPKKVEISESPVKISAGEHSACVTTEGSLYVWGTGVFGECLIPSKMICSGWLTEVSVGGGFGCALDRSGIAWSWGNNSAGALGLGDMESKSQPYPILELQSKSIESVSCGGSFVIAMGEEEVLPTERSGNSSYFPETHDYSSEIDELRKEITKLEKGEGGVEDLEFELEESKFKEEHLKKSLEEEENQREKLSRLNEELEIDKEQMIITIDHLKNKVNMLSGSLLTYEHHAEDISSEADELKSIISYEQNSLEQTLKEKSSLSVKTKRLEERVKEQDFLIENQSNEIIEKEGKIKNLKGVVRDYEENIHSLNMINEELRCEIEELQEEKREIEQGISIEAATKLSNFHEKLEEIEQTFERQNTSDKIVIEQKNHKLEELKILNRELLETLEEREYAEEEYLLTIEKIKEDNNVLIFENEKLKENLEVIEEKNHMLLTSISKQLQIRATALRKLQLPDMFLFN